MDDPIRVMIVDDHEVVRRGIADVIDQTKGLEVIAEASSVAEAARRLPAVRPDLMLVDLQLPDGTGIDVMRDALRLRAEQKMLVLTSFDDAEAVRAAREVGAQGFVLKTVRARELVDTIRDVMNGGEAWKGVSVPQETSYDEFGLTDIEMRIVELIGAGQSNREIADELGIAEKTVKNRLTQILSKMGLKRRTQVAAWAASQQSGWHVGH